MAKKKIISFVITFIIFALLDIIAISVLILPLYQENLSNILRQEAIVYSSVLAWFIITLGITQLANKISKSKKESFSKGALLGLVIYGVYDLTNYSIIRDWTLSIVIIDILWGMLLCGIVSVINKSI